MSSVASMLRRVVRGERAAGWILDVVMMIGRAPGTSGTCSRMADSSSKEAAREGPLGEDVFDLRRAG